MDFKVRHRSSLAFRQALALVLASECSRHRRFNSQHLKAFETSTCNAYDLSIPHFAMPISCVCMCSYKHLRLEHPAVALCLEHHLSHPLMHPRGTPRKH